MTNIEKMLDAMARLNGNALHIRVNEQPAIRVGQESKPISSQKLGEREVGLLISEWKQVFNEEQVFTFRSHEYQASVTSDSILIRPFQKESEGNERELNLDQLLRDMVNCGASDLHLSSGCRPMMRIDGDMAELDSWGVIAESVLMDQMKAITPDVNLKEYEDINDTDFAYEIPDLARFRSNLFRDKRGSCAVFRMIPSEIIPHDKLGVPAEVVDLCSLSKGLLLVTGPTGSGKSTTLAALVDHVNRTGKKHIITVEDPVEFVHENRQSLVNQREVHSHTSSFKRALRAALREDPDVILVGEMRDLETIAIAVEMAVTGHLVFGTLHTSTAVGTVDRIVDQFPSDQQSQIRIMLSDALVGVVSQVLCKKKGGGRVAAYEVLIVTPSVSNLIRESKTFQIPSLMQTGRSLGMRTMNDALMDLVSAGKVDANEALLKSVEPDDLRKTLKNKGLL